MKSYNPRATGTKESFEDRQRFEQQYSNIGNADRPPLPRELMAQPGAQKVLLTWSLAAVDEITAHWRVYRDTESNLIKEISDRGTRQIFIDIAAGATPQTYNFFVAGVSASGTEGPKASVQGSALAELGAPPRPSAPDAFSQTASGAGNKAYGPNRLSKIDASESV